MERDLCGNCGAWREEHYGGGGQFIAHMRFGCMEYNGVQANDAQRKSKDEDIAKRRTKPWVAGFER
jgi:hypothetical protein